MSNYNKQIVNNSIFSVIQIIVVSVSAFLLYKYIISTIGIEKLGLWSLILSVTSLATIGNFGFTGSLIKFSAELSLNNKFKKINAILNASVVSVGVILLILLLVVYIVGYNYIGFFVDEKWVSTAQNLLFFALISLYLNIIAGLYFSILEGLNMAYLRALSFIIATISYVVLCFFLIEKYDIMGLAYAQIIQALLFFTLGFILIKIKVVKFNWFYFKWHKKLMKKVFNYGINFQMMGLSQMLYDPITKVILSRYGGLDFVAIFEMASKIVIQVRAIPAAIIQNVLPKIVQLKTTLGPTRLLEAYKKINIINLFLIFSSIVLVIPFSNIISVVILGSTDTNFIIVIILIAIGWLLNALIITPYTINLGTGNLKWNVISHIVIGILNFIFCLLLGYLFKNGLYIILGWVMALSIGSMIILIEYHLRNKISFLVSFNTIFFKLFISLIVLLILSFLVNSYLENLIWLITVQSILIFIYFAFITTRLKTIKDTIISIIKIKRL